MKINDSFCYRQSFLLILLILSWNVSFSQISLQKFPKNNQVFQRDEQDEALFLVNGVVTENGHSSVSLVILQDGKPFSRITIKLAATKTFDFAPKLKAGKFDYTIKLYLDSTKEIKAVNRVAAGDVFLIYGQSNALGNGGYETYKPPRNPLIRYFRQLNFDNGESEWFLPYETFYWPSIGSIELGNALSSKFNYPIGIIEASVGGAFLSELNNRTQVNPADKGNVYGRMLLQTNNSDLKNQIKYIIFRQGESDGTFNKVSVNYPAEFEKLYNHLIIDFPSLVKIYNFQLNILTEDNDKASFLRDFQRKTKYLYPKITTLSTVGTTGYDGVHYNFSGYSQTVYELSRIIGAEIYHDNLSKQIYSPDIKSVYWENNKLVLEFEKEMSMFYPKDSSVNGYLYKMNEFLYVDGENDVVEFGEAIGNKVYLTVKNFERNQYLTYLPSSFSTNTNQPYNGVNLKNALGMRAFSFENIKIGGQETITIPLPTIATKGATSFCEGESIILTTTSGYEEYRWFKDGILIPNNSTRLAVFQSGKYTVQVLKSGFFIDSKNSITISVKTFNVKPIITKIEQPDKFLLMSNNLENNQWFFNEKLINGAISQTYIPQELGNYSVKFTKDGCSNISENFVLKMEKPTLLYNGSNTICEGDSLKITAPIGFSSYLFSDGFIETTVSKNDYFVKKAGNYSVSTKRGTFVSPISDLISIKTKPSPKKPNITIDNNILKSSSIQNNQWYVDGKILKDSTNQNLYLSGGGVYSVRVIENGCFSEETFFVITSNEPIKNDVLFKLYPNPNAGSFWIEVPEIKNLWQIDIYDVHGRNIFSELYKKDTQNKKQINIKANNGIFVLKISSQNINQSTKFIID